MPLQVLDIALTDAGFNPRTSRYNFSRAAGSAGDVLLDSTQAYAVMVSAASVRGGYWADANHGSDFPTLQNLTRLTPSPTPSLAEAMTLAALLPLEQAR